MRFLSVYGCGASISGEVVVMVVVVVVVVVVVLVGYWLWRSGCGSAGDILCKEGSSNSCRSAIVVVFVVVVVVVVVMVVVVVVVVVVVAVNVVLVVVVGYRCWRSGCCVGGDRLCKGYNNNKCRSALVKVVVVMVPGIGEKLLKPRPLHTHLTPPQSIQIDELFLIITATLTTAITTTTIPPSPTIPYHHYNHHYPHHRYYHKV